MIGRQLLSRLRALALPIALFALTLAVLQPLAHAMLLRSDGPQAATALWGALCQPSADKDESGSEAPGLTSIHECCFGLAHAPVLAVPSVASVAIEQIEATSKVHTILHHPSTGAIRDGPNQPRAPPFLND